MYNGKTEIFFPPRLIPELQNLREESWSQLVNHIASLSENHAERLGFLLMMIRLGGCSTCHADAYWAMQGCARCSRNTVTRFRGSDAELLTRYEAALKDIEEYLNHQPVE